MTSQQTKYMMCELCELCFAEPSNEKDSSVQTCDMCNEKDSSVGLSGCEHPEHKTIKICKYCDIDGSNYNGWCDM